MLFRPERLALAGIAFYVVVFLLAPVKLVFPVEWTSMGYILLCYVAFLVGCGLVAPTRGQFRVSADDARQERWRFWVTVLLGAVGMGIKVYDKYINRGAGFGSSALESIDILKDAEAGPLAVVGGILYPFCYVPLIMWWTRSQGVRPRGLRGWVAWTLFLLPALDGLYLLSRSQMLLAASMMYFATSLVRYDGRLLPRQMFFALSIGMLSVLVISAAAFSSRLIQMNVDIVYSILNSAYGYVVTPAPWVSTWMRSTNEIVSGSLSGVVPILQYYLHGMFEFGILWDRPDPQPFANGALHFNPYLKAIRVLGAEIPYPSDELYYRSGVFTTFFGPLWIDFGWLGPLVMIAFGAFAKHVAERARTGDRAALPLNTYFCVVLFFMPVVNFIVSAQGMYIFNALFIFWVVASQRRFRVVDETPIRGPVVQRA